MKNAAFGKTGWGLGHATILKLIILN